MATRNDTSKDIVKNSSQEIIPPAKPWLFQKGNSLGGRPKGSRSKFAEVFLKDFLADWEEHGVEVLVRCREDDPSTYLRVASAILPKELNIKEGESAIETLLEKFGDQQLDEFIAGVIALGAAEKSAGAKIKTLPGKKPNGVH